MRWMLLLAFAIAAIGCNGMGSSSPGGGGNPSPPSITSLNPVSGSVGASVTITGSNFGATQGTSTVKFNGITATPASWSATSIVAAVPTGATTGNVVVTVGGVASNGVNFTVLNSVGTGPLRTLASNPHYFTDGSGKAILLSGSHTWNDVQDTGNAGATTPIDYNAYVNFLKAHGQNATILWHKDLPTFCSWGAGGTWRIADSGFPWVRSSTPGASDGFNKWDLSTFNQAYFDRLRARTVQLQQNGIYAIVEFFDGLGLLSNRCSNDGYPFTGGNNVNGVDDGGGTNSMTGTVPNAFTVIQLAYIKKVIDTLNDLPNVVWEPSEEAPSGSAGWNTYMIAQIQAYEAGKPLQHPILYATLTNDADTTLYDSNAMSIAPHARVSAANNCSGSGNPQCKVTINDSDHSYFGMWNDDAQTNRNYLWENFTNGSSVIFMDPYLIYAGSGNSNWTNRNPCDNNVQPAHGVCTIPDTRWDNFRDNMGYTLSYGNKMDLAKMTPQGSLSSTGHCLAQTPATGAEYLVYDASGGGSFTVDLTAMPSSRTLNVEWLNPNTGSISPAGAVGAGATRTFTAPFGGDAVLYLVDAAGHN